VGKGVVVAGRAVLVGKRVKVGGWGSSVDWSASLYPPQPAMIRAMMAAAVITRKLLEVCF
jgi:hypothetical protein